MKRYILTVGDSFDPGKVDMTNLNIISFTTCRDFGEEPLPTLGDLAGLFDRRTEFICMLRWDENFRCKRDSDIISHYYSRYRVKNMQPLTDSVVRINLDYPIGEEPLKE